MHRTPLVLAVLSVLAISLTGTALGQSREATASAGRVQDPAEWIRLAQRHESVDQDFERANQLYCRAAKAGNAEAQFRLGWIYASGRGVRKDEGVAAVLFGMAADQGHEYARRRLRSITADTSAELPRCLRPDRIVPGTAARRDVEVLVKQLAPRYSIDPSLVMALISVESGFNPKAVSPKNAQGLMQLIPETAERFGVKRMFDPVDNIQGGLAYLRWLMAFFQGEVPLVLAAYNAGERAVERYSGVPPYQETQNYVRRITSIYTKRSHPYHSDVTAPSPMLTVIRRQGA